MTSSTVVGTKKSGSVEYSPAHRNQPQVSPDGRHRTPCTGHSGSPGRSTARATPNLSTPCTYWGAVPSRSHSSSCSRRAPATTQEGWQTAAGGAALRPRAVHGAIAWAFMPELPEVESARSVIERLALGRPIVDVDDADTYVCRPHRPGQLRSALVGRELTAAFRRGKSMWC